MLRNFLKTENPNFNIDALRICEDALCVTVPPSVKLNGELYFDPFNMKIDLHNETLIQHLEE